MNTLDRLEKRFGRFAIPNVMRIFTVIYAIGLVLWIINPAAYVLYLALNPSAILRGQVWRLVTWLLFPPGYGENIIETVVYGAMGLYFYYWVGGMLEQSWGRFRFNFYLFLGILFHITAAFFVNFVMHSFVLMTPTALNLSLFLAFALTYPNLQIYFMGLFPVRAIYLAVLYVGIELYYFIMGTAGSRVAILLSLLNLGLYLHWSGALKRLLAGKFGGTKRRQGNAGGPKIIPLDSAKRKKEAAPEKTARHRCEVCGRTELTNPELEFRYCSKCQGDHEYCNEHLNTHTHTES